MKFQTKIFFATLIILISTLSLNSVLSISSFESIYVDSLISIYETGGKNLKRKIEQSLRLGKPLDKFQGMENLLKDFMVKNTYIEFTGIINPQNEIIYHTDKSRKGSLLEYKIPEFFETKAITRAINNFYITFIPLEPFQKKIRGYIFLGVNKSAIREKIQDMAFSNFKTLSILILITGILLIFFLGLIIVHPMKSDIKKLSLTMTPFSENSDTDIEDINHSHKNMIQSNDIDPRYSYFDITRIKNEIFQLSLELKNFYDAYVNGVTEIEKLKNDFFGLTKKVNSYIDNSEEELKLYMEKYPEDSVIQPLLTSVIKENIHIKELMQLSFLFLSPDKDNKEIKRKDSGGKNEA